MTTTTRQLSDPHTPLASAENSARGLEVDLEFWKLDYAGRAVGWGGVGAAHDSAAVWGLGRQQHTPNL